MTTTAPATTTDGSRRPTFSVRTRITVAVAMLVALALAGAGLIVFLLGRAGIDERVRAQVSEEMERFASAPRRATVGETFEAYLSTHVGVNSELLVGYTPTRTQQSYSPRGEVTRDPAFVSAVDTRLRDGGAVTIASDWGPVYVDVQPVRDSTTSGAFVVAYFLQDDHDALARTMRTYAVAALLALVLVTTVAAWQAGRLLQPLRTLRETAAEIEEGDLSRRIPETGNDDITELTHTFNAMLARLESAFAGQRAFLDDAGHELRTPLTIVRGHLELMASQDSSEVERTRDLVLDEVDRMSRLVDDLILLAKADRPDFVAFTDVEVGPLVDVVLEKCRALGDRTWVLDGRADLAVPLDEQRITQAVLQLAHNAVRHTRPGDLIGLGSAVHGDRLALWVRDTGPGVADEHKAVVFERFGRGETRDGDEGFGLGLSIVAAIVAGHGGNVGVGDEEPHGARFTITLPTGRSVAWPAS